VSLPKGGGAIRGIDEKFSVSQATGTSSVSIPVFTSPARQGFGPQLTLSYDSGVGNGPFGLGWTLALPSITRKTSLGLPRYHDDADSDVFILAGSTDLVPLVGDFDAERERDESIRVVGDRRYLVRRYRPRVESAFARIERWHDTERGDVHWRTI
jgi:Salmonella virulence plasmid 65kDa B protein